MLNRRATALVFFAALFGLSATAFADAENDGVVRLITGDCFTPPVRISPAPLPPPTNTLQPLQPSELQVFRTFHFGAETNFWPFWVGQKAPATPDNPFAAAGPTQQWNAAGPFRFSAPLGTSTRWDDGSVRVQGLRPFYVEKRDAANQLLQIHILYPLFNWTRLIYGDGSSGYRWDVFSLINHEHAPARNPTTEFPHDDEFDIWPFYFSKQSSDPDASYRAVFPIYGNNVTGHLLQDRLDWFLFPLYFRRTLNGTSRTFFPWPIVSRTTGNGADGFALWPLFGGLRKTDPATNTLLIDDSFFLWPIFIHSIRTDPDTHAITEKFGVLPFYYSETAPGLRAESFFLLWGYSHSAPPAPKTYDEYRYLWPLWLTVRGDIYRNRFAPFYTHSIVNERDKTWLMWPLWCSETWPDAGGQWQYHRRRFFFFLYHDLTQNPLPPAGVALTPEQKARYDHAPVARKLNIWPLLTYWTDGRGHRQFQLFSPLEVFLPTSEPTRQIYTPFFAIYRYEQAAPGHYRHSFLWNFVTYRHEPDLREFHLGPLYSGERVGDYKRRALFCGVLGLQKTPDKGWRPFAFKFKSLQRQLAEKDKQDRILNAPAVAAANTTAREPLLPRRRM